MARRRPSAFEVSFPEELEAYGSDPETAAEPTNTYLVSSRSSSVLSNATSTSLGKRKADSIVDFGKAKRRQLPKAQIYQRPNRVKEVQENAELVVYGEEPDDDNDVDDEGGDKKPVRVLDNFAIFDPKHGCEMVTLDALEQDDGVDRQFEAAGMVSACFDNDEDEGQDDEVQDAKPLYLRLGAILRFTFEYTADADPFYIETQYAWYILGSPSQSYREHWEHFCRPHRIAQLVISRALERPREDYATFLRRFESKTLLGRTFVEKDLWEHIVEIQDAVLDEPIPSKIMAVPFVKHILARAPARPTSSRSTRPKRAKVKAPKKIMLLRDIDSAVLKPEYQTPTRVTPRIAKLAEGYFQEEIMVVGSAPPPVNKAALEERQRKIRRRVWGLIERTRQKKIINYHKDNRVSVADDCYKEVTIDREIYRVGDVILVPGEEPMPTKLTQLPEDAQIHDYFWFAKVLYFIIDNQVVHVQWFNHGSQTFVGELAHPRELFLADHCDTRPLKEIVGKVNVHYWPAVPPDDKPEDYICKLMHSLNEGAFRSIDSAALDLFESQLPPYNCPVCPLQQERDNETTPRAVAEGVVFGGTTYHYEDFVLYRAEQGPANIGYITKIDSKGKEFKVSVRRVGRIPDLKNILPSNVLRDERHLYLTDEVATVKVTELLKIIYVPCIESFQPPRHSLEDWLAQSYDHFYITYSFPTLKAKSWNDKQRIHWQDLHVCTPCCRERLQKRTQLRQFLNSQDSKPLKALDLFGGVGAFSRGIAEGSGFIKVEYAIEISPSAAKTFSRNSPETVVSNQCVNEMLRYIIKSQEGHQVEVPKQKFDDKTPIPAPPKSGKVDVITAGFPCQSHSTLNIFRNANDIKSNLILTTLSYMDYYSPRFGYFENVPGFLRYNLNSRQVNKHRTEGGIQSGGLKLFVRALLDMNYQVRIGQLQAGHFGAPQRRVRFFIVAAKQGQVLPDFPQPTHDFPENKTLQITVKVRSKSHTLSPVRFGDGIAQHPFVSIADSISDLPRFDWKHPKPSKEPAEVRRQRRERERSIPSFECYTKSKYVKPYCGLQGQTEYQHEPQTRYQKVARSEQTMDIQQYTRRFNSASVERVLNIPLVANADYTSLKNGLHQWQHVDPSSATGRKNYKPGAYGRLDESSIFQTTVTNMQPTAKQSRVLHPHDHRMVTVRELARSQGFPDSFVFEALGDNVITMHRQIGNAVPLPIGQALGRELRESLFKKWLSMRENAMIIDSDDEEDDRVRTKPREQRRQLDERRNQDENESDMDIY